MSDRPSPTTEPPCSEIPAESNLPENIDRRTFLIRNAVIGAAAAMTGTVWTAEARAQQAAKEAAEKSPLPPLDSTSMSQDLDVVKRSKGPILTVLEEFYKVGPGPSSSHTIGPMRITYDFYHRRTRLPAAGRRAEGRARARALRVHLSGARGATAKGHGTERACLAGIVGKEPATIDPAFLAELAAQADQTLSGQPGSAAFDQLRRG